MYSSIILVGGGIKFPGAEKWLHQKLSTYRHIPVKTENPLVSAKEIDPSMVTWKGAAIMAGLESANELFINKNDWDKQGVKILRERAPFIW